MTTLPVNILVVDDEPGMRLTLKGILAKKGYHVTVAADGLQAVEAVQKSPFAAILMDIKMPGMSGVEAFLKIKKINPQASVIMMTGYAMEEDIVTALTEGASVLSKPLDMNKVLDLLKNGTLSGT